MIKCLCKENVQDKYTGENYVAGNEYKFTEERAKEVTNSRYFEYVTESDVVDNSTSSDETVTKPRRRRSAK